MTTDTLRNADIQHDINELIAKRWSPRAFDTRKAVTPAQVRQLFEAARWAPSSYNAQPWQYAYAHREDDTAFQHLLDTLMPGNQEWAKDAAVLIAGLTQVYDPEKDRKNGKAEYDLGAANYALTMQATEMGLFVHQMGGFHPNKVSALLDLPEHIKPVVMLAVGHLGNKEDLPAHLAEREVGRKERKSQKEFVQKL